MDARRENRVPTEQPVRVTILGDSSGVYEAVLSNLSGRGMQIMLPAPVAVNTAVRIDLEDSMLLGEVCYCEPAAAGWAIGLELEQSLSDLRSLCRLVERLLQEEQRRMDAVPSDSLPSQSS